MSFLDAPLVESGGGYSIANSLRLRASASAYLSRTTPASGGDRDKWWIYIPFKLGTLGVVQYLHGADTVSADAIYLNASFQLCVDIAGVNRLVSNRVFRDPSAWGALYACFDAANATAAQRLRVYERSEGNTSFAEITSWATDTRSAITTGTAKTMHNSIVHVIGKNPTAASGYFDGYITQHRIGTWSGTQPTPANFGSVNSDGIWVDSGASTSYGTSGSFLPFSNGSSLTTLGNDASGNGNNWTLNNFSLTAGATYDWMVDTPTNNYATLDPLNPTFTDSMGSYLTNGNLLYTGSGDYSTAKATIPFPTTGVFYVEVTLGASGAPGSGTLPAAIMRVGSQAFSANSYPTYNHSGYAYAYDRVGAIFKGSNTNSYVVNGLSTVTNNDVVGMEFNATAQTVKWWKGTTLLHTLDLSAAPDGYYGNDGGWMFACGLYGGTAPLAVNIGQQPFVNKAANSPNALTLCTANRGTGSITTSGSFTGNASADGPFIWLNGNPESLTINGNAVTWGTHADKLAGGFKVRTASASYNASGTNTYTVTTTGKLFGDVTHAPNTAKANP